MNDDCFRKLVNAWLDREITPDELARLQSELSGSSERLSAFHQYIRIHEAEKALFGELPSPPLKRTRQPWNPEREEARVRRCFLIGSAAAAAVFALVVSCYIAVAWPDDDSRPLEAANGSTDVIHASNAPTEFADPNWSGPGSDPSFDHLPAWQPEFSIGYLLKRIHSAKDDGEPIELMPGNQPGTAVLRIGADGARPTIFTFEEVDPTQNEFGLLSTDAVMIRMDSDRGRSVEIEAAVFSVGAQADLLVP